MNLRVMTDAPQEKEQGALRVGTTFGEGELGSISFYFRDIERVKASEVNAVLEALCHVPGVSPWSFQGRINLLSLSSREAFARAIARPAKGFDFPADIALGSAVSAVLKHLSSKDESIWLDEATPQADGQWLMEPLLLKNAPNVLFGKGGGGKTYLSLRLAMSVTTGLPFLGMAPTESGKVLFVDYEDEPGNLAHRLWKLAGSTYAEFKPDLDGISGSIRYLRAKGVPFHDLVDTVKRIVRSIDVKLVIIDSAALACGGEPEKAESAIRFFNAISKLETTTLTIAHETKTENHDYVFGSVFFHNSARNIWNVQVDHDDVDSRVIQVGLFHRKCNHGTLRRAIPVRFYHGDGFVDVGRGDFDLWEKEMTVSDRVLGRLKERSMTRRELETDLASVNRESLKNALHRLQKSGLIELLGGQGGMYRRTIPIERTEPPEN